MINQTLKNYQSNKFIPTPSISSFKKTTVLAPFLSWKVKKWKITKMLPKFEIFFFFFFLTNSFFFMNDDDNLKDLFHYIKKTCHLRKKNFFLTSTNNYITSPGNIRDYVQYRPYWWTIVNPRKSRTS